MDIEKATDVAAEQRPNGVADGRRGWQAGRLDLLKGFRIADIEPYTGLRYLSKLFRFMAIILVLLLIAEVAMGLYAQGAASIPTLLGEASRLIVLAGVLWGTGDLAHLLIDIGHDVRASRILLARQTHVSSTDRVLEIPVPPRNASDGETSAPPIP